METDISFPQSALITGEMMNAPDIVTIIEFIILGILLLGSALMSGSEVAYFSLKPDDLEKVKNDKSKRAACLLRLLNMPERLLSTILVGNNIVNITIVLLAAFISTKLFDFSGKPVLGFIVQAVIITFILLLFGEILPKVYATHNNLRMAFFMARPLTLLDKLLRPATSLLILSTSFVKKRTAAHRSAISMDDLSDALEMTSPEEFEEDERILKGIVNFGNINVREIMCPRIDVTAVDIREKFSNIIPVIIESGFSRIPVYSGSFDNVKGILYAKDVLPYMDNTSDFRWQTLLRPPYFVPETKKINDLLKEFQIKKIHMAIVIDEYGGTSGVITLEDILEEIVGEITDESDEEEPMFRKLDENTWIFEGKTLLNDFNKVLNLEDDPFEHVKGESETLAGLILELTGEIPHKNQTINYRNFTFRIESADRRRIKEIKVEIHEENTTTEND